jgi:hypothetical protein
MKNFILLITTLNVMFLFMHEFDAFYRGEWKMFPFLIKLKASAQYSLFLYLHIPLTLFCFYYLWSSYNFNNFALWIGLNIFSIFHLALHILALKWKTNVFTSPHSFLFIVGYGVTGCINVILMGHYPR